MSFVRNLEIYGVDSEGKEILLSYDKTIDLSAFRFPKYRIKGYSYGTDIYHQSNCEFTFVGANITVQSGFEAAPPPPASKYHQLVPFEAMTRVESIPGHTTYRFDILVSADQSATDTIKLANSQSDFVYADNKGHLTYYIVDQICYLTYSSIFDQYAPVTFDWILKPGFTFAQT
jgi:hypothetical protein